MELVAVVGKKRSGKDTVCEMIRKQYESITYALADPIKKVLAHCYIECNLHRESGVQLCLNDFYEGNREAPVLLSNKNVLDLMYKSVIRLKIHYGLSCKLGMHDDMTICEKVVMKNNEPWSIRRFMQVLGTDIVVNHYDTEFWNRCMLNAYLDARLTTLIKYFIVSDVRQYHEMSLMRDMKAKIVHINRINKDTTNSVDEHITEKGIEPIEGEFIIENDATLVELNKKVLDIF